MKCRSFAGFIFLLFVGSCHGRPTIERSTPAAAEIARHPHEPTRVAAPGIVAPRLGEILLAPLESGRLDALLVTEGERVEPATVVARLDASTQRAALAVAQAEVHQAQARLEALVPTREDLRLTGAELAAATERANQSLREAQRGAQLVRSGAVTVAEQERWDTSARADAAVREVARARSDATVRGATRAERGLARAGLEAAQARLQAAHDALLRREVRAPQSGVVLWSRRHVGEFVAPGTGTLMILGDLEHLEARLEVDELDARFVALGTRCELRGDGGEPRGAGTVVRSAAIYGVRGLTTERTRERSDARVREIFIEIDAPTHLLPGERVWGYIERASTPTVAHANSGSP